MDIYFYIGITIAAFVFFLIQARVSNKTAMERIRKEIRKQWGMRPNREYEYHEYEKISHYFKNTQVKGEAFIDDITWNDLDMDNVFMLLNTTRSSVGEEYLYKMLRSPVKDESVLKERSRLIDYFVKDKEKAFKLEEIFAGIGRTKGISLYDFIFRLKFLGNRSNILHYTLDALLLLGIGYLFVAPQYAILLIILMFIINVVKYYKIKSEIESYFICFTYIVGMLIHAEKICKLNDSGLEAYNMRLKEACKTLQPLKKGIFLLSSTNVSGSIGDTIMEYVRMLFHVDLIKFNSMLTITNKNVDTVNELFEVLGQIESAIAIASFRDMVPQYCEPKLLNSKKLKIHAKDVYHPLIENPVKNTISESKGVLLTGSNASGKSTFLKTIAINALFAQTIFTCLADEYYGNYYRIYSSMALRDSLESNESYYMVEIKSLKRILDHISDDEPILCFVDEVLRGTNTVERIAASSHILKSLSERNVLCFAATHDIELTHILENHYSNYHFQEEVKNNDILFNYILYKGRAVSRNAIKLLGIIGYEGFIIKSAEEAANYFIKEGIWKKA